MSDNELSADYQQERSIQAAWISGFVDGEGYFGINIVKNKTMKFGLQIQPEFVVTQSAKSLSSLQFIKNFFSCGHIFINRRYDNHRENIYRYCVRRLNDLNKIIIPFFKFYQLKTCKIQDFQKFELIIEMMNKKEHLTLQGFECIKKILNYSEK